MSSCIASGVNTFGSIKMFDNKFIMFGVVVGIYEALALVNPAQRDLPMFNELTLTPELKSFE